MKNISPVDSGSTSKTYKTLDEAIEAWLYLMRRQLTGMPEIHKTEILKWCELSFSAGWLEREILGSKK